MSTVKFDNFGDGETVVVYGIFIARCLDGDGEERLRITTIGDPALWDQAMLAQAALDRSRGHLKAQWGD